MNIRYRVTLTADERQQLQALLSGGQGAVRTMKRAQILLAADAHSTDDVIARTVGVGTSTVYRTKQRFVEDGLVPALSERPRPGGPRKLGAHDGRWICWLVSWCASPRMEDVLDLYAEAPDPQRPVVCFDETPRQLIGEARVPIPAELGKPRRVVGLVLIPSSSTRGALLREPSLAHPTERWVVPAPPLGAPHNNGADNHYSDNDVQHLIHAR